MSEFRKGDVQSYSKYRSSRYYKDSGKWYFYTREATIEGPFEHRWEAEENLETYVRILNSGFYATAHELTLEPIQPRDTR